MSAADDLARMGEHDFVALTTFRRSGAPVSTPVWIAPSGEGSLLVTTPTGSGKVKRLRHTSEVELRPCSRRGTVPDGAPVVLARADVQESDEAEARAHRLLGAKYRLQFRIIMGLERVMRRGHTDRVILRITPRD